MKRTLLGIIMLVAATVLLTACGAKSPDEKSLLQKLPQNVLQFELDGEQYTSKATSLTIVKQQTDKTSDVSYCEITCESDVIDRTLYLILYSEYGNKQWNITGVQEYQNEEIKIKKPPVTLDEGRKQIEDAGYSGIVDVEDCSDLDNNLYRYHYSIYEDHENRTTEGDIYVEGYVLDYGLGNYSWQDNSCDNVSKNWKLTGIWLDSTSGDTIQIDDDGTYLTMSYSYDLVNGKRVTGTGQAKRQTIQENNNYYGYKDEYLITMWTYQASGSIDKVSIRLYPDTAYGGTGYSTNTMKRIS